jgi:acyl-CoA synthetase (AMP-forming)/AMP-acid ligase II
MIICGGNNVYPAEVEAVVAEHPAVSFCSVVGLPDERRGEVPVVAVVPREGRDVDAGSVIAHCRERIAAFKVPRAVYVVPALPLGPTGKVLKHVLRDDLVDGRHHTAPASGAGDRAPG